MTDVQAKQIWWMFLLLTGHFYKIADGTVRVSNDGAKLEGWHLDSAGIFSPPESRMMDSLILASRSGETTGIPSRIKRGVLFPSGVKLCSQETVKQALQNHLDFFYLRVCQETVWEAFKIFWDRLPKRDEYQLWINRCQNGSISVFDIGRSFSQSPEHLAIIMSRVQMTSATGQQTTGDPTKADIISKGDIISKADIISATDGVASVTSQLAEANPTDTTAKTIFSPTEARVTSQEPGVTLTEVMATTGHFTDAPTNMIVSTQQSTVSPNIAIATTGEYLNTLTEATLTTEQFADITTEVRASAKQFTNNSSDSTASTQQFTDIATKVIATAAQSTNTPSKTIVTTELLSMDTPTEEMLTTEQSTDSPAKAIERSTDSPNETMLTTKQFMDIEAEVIATAKQSINTPKDTTVSTERSTIITVTTGESINTPTKTLVPTEQSMAIPTELIEHSTDTPKEVIVATQQLVFTPNVGMVTEVELMIAPTEAIETTGQSMDIAIKAVATAKQSPFTPTEAITTTGTIAKTDRSTDIAIEVMATSKQSKVTAKKAIVSTTQLIPVSNMATGLEVTVEVIASVNVTTGISQGVNHNAPGMPLSTTAVVFENGEDDFAHEGFVNSGLGKTKVDTEVASPEKPVQVDDDGVGGTALQPPPSPTSDDSANISLVEPPLSASEDTHQDDKATSGSVIVKEVSGTAKDPSEITNDKNFLDRTKGKYSVSKEKETLTGAEVLLEAPTIELSIQKSTSVAEDVEASTSANLSISHLAKESSEDLREEVVNDKLDTSTEATFVDKTEDAEAAPFVKKTGDAQSQMTVETAVQEVPPNPTVEIRAGGNYRPDSTDDMESPEVISDTNSKDITLALTDDPSVILLDVEDFMPEITPTAEDYTSGTHNMKIDSKEETIEENLLESKGRDRKISEVSEETTLTIPEIKGMDMSKDTEVPEIAPGAAVPGVTNSGLPTNVVRLTGPPQEDDTPAPWVEVEKSTVGLNELTTNMQRNAISSTLQASTETSNNNIDKGNMIGNEIANILPRPARPIMDQVVELSIKLRGEMYDDALRDPSSFHYQHLSEQFIEKIEDAYKKLPGFQRVFIREYRPQKDIQGGLAVVVHYSIVLEGDVAGISNETMTDITLQSNQVEKSYMDLEEQPTVVYTVTDLRHYITQALHKTTLGNNGNTSLDVDPDSLQLQNVETLLLSKPTSRPPDSNNMMDNVLAAEKPPDTPRLELSSNDVYIKNHDFLSDNVHPYHPWMDAQTELASENDIIILEDNQATLHTEIPFKTILTTENDITFEEEGFLKTSTLPSRVPVIVPEKAHPTQFEAKITATEMPDVKPLGVEKLVENEHTDMGSGSGFSSNDQNPGTWPWITGRPLGSLEKEVPKAEKDQEDYEKKKLEAVEESEISVDQNYPSEVPSEVNNLLTQDLYFYSQDTTTDQASEFSTIKTPMVELSMQTKEASKNGEVAAVTELPERVYATTKSFAIEGATEINPKTENSQSTTSPTTPITVLVTEASTTSSSTQLEDTTTETNPVLVVTEPPVVVDIKAETVEESPIVPSSKDQPRLPETFESETSNVGVEIIHNITFKITQAPVLEFSDEDLAKDEIITATKGPSALISEAPNVDVSTPRSTEKESAFTRIFDDTLVEDTSLLRSTVKPLPSHTSYPIIPEEMTPQAPSHSTMEKSTNNIKVFRASHSSTTSVSVTSNSTDISKRDLPIFQPTDRIKDTRVSSDDRLTENDLLSTPSIPELIFIHENKDNGSRTAQSRIPENPGITDLDVSFDIIQYDDENGSGFIHGSDMASVAMPVSPGRALMVFFSLRVTNMMFSQDLFNKSSSEYKTLERQFLDLLVPYLQSNLSNFQRLEILNFRNGSIVVNSRLKFEKPVPIEVTSAVYLILENFCNTAYQTMNLAIDKHSLDVESGDRADPCKFQACNEFSKCTVNQWSGEVECVCDAGYFSVDGLPCRSICDIQEDFCLNDGKCDVIPGNGAICRCRVGENWWYRGEHCEEYVSEPLVVGIAISSVAGFLLVASGVIIFLTRMLREQYDDKDNFEDSLRHDVFPSLESGTRSGGAFESDVPVMRCGRYQQAHFDTSDEMQHVYENSQLAYEEIPDRVRILELSTKDQQLPDFARQLRV